jgi:hypothetical protein
VLTLLQTGTLDGWSSIIRSFRVDKEGRPDTGVSIYFVTYILFASIIMLNVVIAILLEGFVSAVEQRELKNRYEEEAEEQSKAHICVCTYIIYVYVHI